MDSVHEDRGALLKEVSALTSENREQRKEIEGLKTKLERVESELAQMRGVLFEAGAKEILGAGAKKR